jgi:hypothetical protein
VQKKLASSFRDRQAARRPAYGSVLLQKVGTNLAVKALLMILRRFVA